MFLGRIRAFAAAVAAIGAALLIGGSRAEAAIELIVSDGATTSVFYSSSDTKLTTPTFTVGGYTGQIDTTITNYPGSPFIGFITTTLNMSSVTNGSPSLTATAMVIANVAALDPTAGTGPLAGANLAAVLASPQLVWSSPAISPVVVSADTSSSHNLTLTAGTATTTTYYNSPPVAAGPGTAAVSSGALTLASATEVFKSTLKPNSGTYSLAQSIKLSGITGNAGGTVEGLNVTGNSGVTPTPEPSTMALTGLGALGLAGYGLRRRKVLGA